MTKEKQWEELQQKPKPVDIRPGEVASDAWFHFDALWEEEEE